MSGLEVEGLAAEAGGRRVLEDVALAAAPGELVALVGPSGAGKSTLLRCVAGLHETLAGRVAVDGRDVTAAPPAARGVAMVFQSYALFPHLSVAENIGFGLRARGAERGEREARVRDAAVRLHIEDLLGRRPAQLSGGERQRVALARALAGRPAVLLLDEPLSNLDAPLRARARAELRELLPGAGPAVLHVTHDQHEALTLGTRVAVLVGGRLLQEDTPDVVYERPAARAVAAFLGSPAMNLLPATVDGDAVRAGPVVAPRPPGAPDGPVVLGIRPEHLRVVAAGGQSLAAGGQSPGCQFDAHVAAGGQSPGCQFEARVEYVERAGHDVVWHVRAGEHRLAVRPPAGAQEAERVTLSADAADVRLFADDDEGRALC